MEMLNVDGDNKDQEDFDNTIQSKKEDAFEFMTVGNMKFGTIHRLTTRPLFIILFI